MLFKLLKLFIMLRQKKSKLNSLVTGKKNFGDSGKSFVGKAIDTGKKFVKRVGDTPVKK